MANIEMYDYLDAATPDYGDDSNEPALSLTPHNSMTEVAEKNQVIHIADDHSEERVSLSDDNIFKVTLQWNVITESEAGTIVDFFFDPAKGNGVTRTFTWEHPTDGHTYVVRFDSSMKRKINPANLYDIDSITLKIIGKI